ncbi:cupin domain-containing protein [Spirosoma endbachense]|uniref:Cupin domain-containing protein n=1 Tax=Spirosoma endbachense TaxID=2666025 RepID=A0A6P1VV02_9BACT|nr:cupin domain-containing protein [Spirosoma endbachense]QHV96454.1 cupin domain-containing protein [Spirosoma endbachense]
MLTEQPSFIQVNDLRAYNGGFFRVLISPEQTGGSFSIIDITLPKGAEPPRHLHTREDETFYILDGTIRFEIGDQVIIGEVGQAVFAPRNIEHLFTLQTEQARMLTLITPGDFANYFVEFSQPIEQAPTTLEAPKGPPPADALALLVSRLTERYGARFA